MISRRSYLGALSASALALSASEAASAQPRPAKSSTYVLVHGAGSGGWVWGRMAPLLRAEGHVVYTPTLTGVGERKHLLRPDTGLETHVQDVLGVLEYEDLGDVILVGHSYGGMVVTGVMVDLTPTMMEMARRSARVENGVEVVLGADSQAVKAVGSSDPAIAAWKHGRNSPWPWKAFTDKVRLQRQAEVFNLPRTIINCTPTLANRPADLKHRALDGDRVWEIDTTHDLMVTEPRKVADMLLKLTSV